MGRHARVEHLVVEFLKEIGEDPDRDGMKETPFRVARMLDELFWGLQTPKFSDFKTFESQMNELVVVTKIPFYSICEHHLLPFFGETSIGYLPTENQTLGLSKFLRLVDYWSKRPNIQERLTKKICEELTENVPNQGVAIVMSARHLCMEIRGVKSTSVVTKTESFSGEFQLNLERRAEFFERIKKK